MKIAKLHFKDGTIQERQLPEDGMLGLFSQTFYRLVDEDGNATNVFEARPNSQNSTVIDYDEVELPQSSESDDF